MTLRGAVPRLLLPVGVVAVIAWAVVNRDRFDPAALDAWLSGLGAWAPVAFVAVYAAGTVAFLPGSLLTLAGGALFGPVWGALLNLLGATIGASIAFLAARHVAGGWVERKAAGRSKRLIDGVEAEGWRFVAFVRLVPLFPFNLTNYALGLTRIGLVPYAVASFICMAPGAVAYTWLGHAGREALAGDASAIRYGLLALGLLAAVAYLPRLIKRLRGDHGVLWTDPDELRRRLADSRAPMVIDVRNPDEFEGSLGHIPGAVNIPLDEMEGRLDTLRESTESGIVVVCLTEKRSAAAAKSLHAAGFDNVNVLRGGMKRWRALETGDAIKGVAAS